MGDYWYTDEYGRKRHVHDDGGSRTIGHSTTSFRHEKIDSNFSEFDFTHNDGYLAPTKCPVCSDEVYFCHCANGGRVFFDTLYPTWEKHPCTISDTGSNKSHQKYSIILPTKNIIQNGKHVKRKTQFGTPNSSHGFDLDTTNEILYKNLIQNVSLLVHYGNKKFFLTIIVTSGKFSGHYICQNKMFNKVHWLKEYLMHILSSVDLAVSIDVERVNKTVDSKGKKVVFVDSCQINQMRGKGKKRRAKEVHEDKKIKFEKQCKATQRRNLGGEDPVEKKPNKKQSPKKASTVESLGDKGWIVK